MDKRIDILNTLRELVNKSYNTRKEIIKNLELITKQNNNVMEFKYPIHLRLYGKAILGIRLEYKKIEFEEPRLYFVFKEIVWRSDGPMILEVEMSVSFERLPNNYPELFASYINTDCFIF